MNVVVEPSAYDGDGDATETVAWLRNRGLTARVGSDFQGANEVWPDVWTSPLDGRLIGLRVSCLADYLLKTRDVIGITGTAGKTTTSWLVGQLLPASVHHRARAGNLWPGASLLSRDGTVLAELTSSHLAFCHHSPRVAAITNFWPDHLEIHGGLEAYAEAKSRIFRFQKPQDVAVLPWHDQAAQRLAQDSPAVRVWFSTGQRPPTAPVRVWPSTKGIRIESNGRVRNLRLHPSPPLLCALAVAAASGLAWSLPERLELPPHRAFVSGRLIDDTLAATPPKASYHLRPGTHLVAGGLREIGGQNVHASPEERIALGNWLEQIRRDCASVDLFGTAGEWMHPQLPGSRLHADFLEAVRHALGACAGPVLVSPGFPMPQDERLRLQIVVTPKS